MISDNVLMTCGHKYLHHDQYFFLQSLNSSNQVAFNFHSDRDDQFSLEVSFPIALIFVALLVLSKQCSYLIYSMFVCLYVIILSDILSITPS